MFGCEHPVDSLKNFQLSFPRDKAVTEFGGFHTLCKMLENGV